MPMCSLCSEQVSVCAESEGAILVVCDAAQEIALRRHLQKAEASQNEL